MSMLNPAIAERRNLFVSPSAKLFGPQWQHAIARSLGPFHPEGAREAIDSRLVRRWASGERVVPIWVISEIAKMLETRAPDSDGMRIRLNAATKAIAVELREFSVVRVTDCEIWIKHRPSADVFEFIHDARRIVGRPTYVPGPLRGDPDAPEIDLLEESARHVARRFLCDNTTKAAIERHSSEHPEEIRDAAANEDIAIFADHCVFIRSVYLHGKILFESSSDEDKARMTRAAPIFFGDINKMFVEYMILQVCKITDPAQDSRKMDNHTIAFLLQHYDFSGDSATMQRLALLDANLKAFRQKLLPARNKLISHADRDAILAGQVLGGVLKSEWDEFWLNLQDLICIIYEKVLGTRFYINGVAMLSDAHGLLSALKHGACFDQLLGGNDLALSRRCADLALG
jgi:hypothetical protein